MSATFADYISKCIFVNETFCILTKTLLKLVPKGSIDNDNTPSIGLDNGLAPNRRQAIL